MPDVEFKGGQGVSLKATPHYLVQSTGTGGAQTFYHGLGKIPDVVMVGVLANTVAYSIASVTASLITLTVDSLAKYSLLLLVED